MAVDNQDKVIAQSQADYQTLLDSFQSVQLGTVNAEGVPDASYTPAIVDETRSFYVYVSNLSSHTQNILDQKLASLMVIEDESTAAQIFARKRVTFACQANKIERDTDRWTEVTGTFIEKFGKMFEHLMGMADFHLIELKPVKGRLVVGFGRAFDVTGDRMDTLEHIRGEGKGHTRVHDHGHGNAKEQELTPEIVKRMVDHMNDDHSDSVLMYVKHFAQRGDATSAILKNVESEAMHIDIGSGETVRIPFDKPLANAHDAHMTMVRMSKEAKQALSS